MSLKGPGGRSAGPLLHRARRPALSPGAETHYTVPMPNHERILIVRPDRIGDVVLSTPLIRALRKRFPAAHLAEMVRPYTADILAKNPHLDEVLIDNPAVDGFRAQVSALRRRRFDTALMLLPSERHSWMLFWAGIRTRIAVGSKIYHRLTFARTVSRRKYIPLRHEADYCLDLGRAIGAGDDGLDTEVFLTDSERSTGLQLLGGKDDRTLVGIHPGSGRSSPNWRVAHYAELAARLIEHDNVHVVLTGSPDERTLAHAFKELDAGRVIDLVGRTSLRETMAVISHLSVLVSASTGTMHIAAALNIPTVSLFCPLPACSPRLWGPRGNRSQVVLPPEGYCQTQCPGDPHICEFEEGITVDTIHREVLSMIG